MILALRQIGPPMIIAAITIGSLLYLTAAFIIFEMLFFAEPFVGAFIRPRAGELWVVSAMIILAAFWPVTVLVYIVGLLIETLVWVLR